MKITRLPFGGTDFEPSTWAWRLSRDVDKEVPWEEIFTLDCPVMEMASGVYHFTDFTILEREIIASNRMHVMWARTSFVDRPDKFEIPPELMACADQDKINSHRDAMVEGQRQGLHQDEWRVTLPLMSHTAFTCRIGFRDLIKYAKYFEYLSLNEAIRLPLRRRFSAISAEFLHRCDEFTGSPTRTHEALDVMNLAKFLHEGTVAERPMVESGGFYVATMAMPVWLRAHFVRHRPLSFIDDLYQTIVSRDVIDMTISEPVTMEIGTSKDFWRVLLGKRSCWLTQSTMVHDRDPWAAIADKFMTVGTQILPCSGGTCPHHKDAMLRVEGRDPGVPCIRFMKLNDIDPEPFRESIEKALESRPSFWRTMWSEMNADSS